MEIVFIALIAIFLVLGITCAARFIIAEIRFNKIPVNLYYYQFSEGWVKSYKVKE